MEHTKIKYGLLAVALFLSCSVFAQIVDKAELSSIQDELLLSVRIKDCNSSQKFYPSVEYYYGNGERIGAKTIQYKSGNNSLACGSTDVLLWKPSPDRTVRARSSQWEVKKLMIYLSSHVRLLFLFIHNEL